MEAPSLIVTGRRRSGRSTALLSYASSALAAGVEVVAVVPKRSPLSELAGREGVRAVLDERSLADLEGLCSGRVLVVIDDVDAIDSNHPGVSAVVQERRSDRAVVVAGPSEHLRTQVIGFYSALKRSRSALVLCPESPYDGALLGVGSLQRSSLFSDPPGRGVLSLGGELDTVQVPFPD